MAKVKKTSITGQVERSLLSVIDELQNNNHKLNVIYDIGANVGDWTKQMRETCPNSSYVMFEANPNNQCKVRLSKSDSYHTILLSDKDDQTINFYLPNEGTKHNTGASYYKELTKHYTHNNYIELKTITLDTYVTNNNLPKPDFIKFDTQGSEVDIINGGKQTIKHAKMLLLEMPIAKYNENAPTFQQYLDTLYNIDFIPTAVERIAVRKGVFNQMDLVFMRKDIVHSIHKYQDNFLAY